MIISLFPPQLGLGLPFVSLSPALLVLTLPDRSPVFLSPKYHLSIRYLASFLATRVSRQTDLWTSHRPSCESTGTPLSHSVVSRRSRLG
jgi:hypothetical protein